MSESVMGHDDRDLDRWIEEVTDAWRLPPPPRGQTPLWSERVAGFERQRPMVGRLLASAAAVTVLGIAAVLLSTSAFAPPRLGGPSSSPRASLPVAVGEVGTVQDDLFELTVETDKWQYAPQEPISISTTLRYVGAADDTSVASYGGRLVGFSIEQVDGPIDMMDERDASCEHHTYRPGDAETKPFRKSGGYSHDDPMADFWRSFYADPELRLPVGTYRISAEARYGPPECGSEQTLGATVQVVVTDPTSPSEAAAWGQARDGLFEVTIESDRAQYAPEEPIGISTTLRYVGVAEETTVRSYGRGLVAFVIEQLDGPVDAGSREFSAGSFTYRTGDVESIPFAKSGGYSQDDPMAPFWWGFFADPELRLPAGTYRIRAEAVYQPHDRGPGSSERSLTPSILVTVGIPAP